MISCRTPILSAKYNCKSISGQFPERKVYEVKKQILVTSLTVFLAILIIGSVTGSVAAGWCQSFSSYTDWKDNKPAVFVYKGRGNPNPVSVEIQYNGAKVANAGNGVQTYSGPQFDLNNGWVGYYISTRWYWTHPGWNDDWRWVVRGCIP